jgi:MFS family permease
VHPLLLLLILLSAIPDTMAAPVVKELLVDRYGASAPSAQIFNGINLLGALAAVPLLWSVRRRWGSRTLLIAASLADGALLAVMALPLGIGWTLALRCLEGVTDVLVFAALFDIVRGRSAGRVGVGLGIASSPLLIGLGLGAVLGGVVVRQAQGVGSAMWLFGVSAALSALVGILAWRWPRIDSFPREPIRAAEEGMALGSTTERVWPPLAMAFADRATGGLLTGTLPIALAQVLGYSPLVRGALVGLPLLLMALGTGPCGWLCDVVGSIRIRLVSGLCYAASFALLPVASANPAALGVVMFIVGVSASGLFASSVSLTVQTGASSVALGAFRASGDIGFLSGTILSVLLLASLGGADPTFADYSTVLLVFAGFHLLTTVVVTVALPRGRKARA